MSAPITDLEVLNTEYAVDGWTWQLGTGYVTGIVILARGRQFACCDGEFCWDDGDFGDGAPVRVAIAVACAYLGVPTPWRLAEQLEGLAKEERDVERELGESPGKGRSSTYEHAAAMARGEGEPGSFEDLAEKLRGYKMSPEETEEQRRSFVYGNCKISNPHVTREMVDRAADEIDAAKAATKERKRCPACLGTGLKYANCSCPTCDGSGEVEA